MKAHTSTSGPQCRHCTVPVDGNGDTCAFCASYTPPATVAQKIDVLVNRVDIIRADGNEILRGLNADAPLFAVADLVSALCHLRQAAVLLDRANDVLEADAAEVRR